jgi:hypothetical protein
VFFNLHYQLVFWAFRTFLFAVAIYAVVIFRQRTYPRRYGWVFILLTYGPDAKTSEGFIIQATGQKIIVYVSILSIMTQSWLAYKFRLAYQG